MNRTLIGCGLGLQAAVLGLGTQTASAQLVTIFTEDFEAFPLGPNVDEGVAFNPSLGQRQSVIFGDLNDDGVPINQEFDGEWTFGGWRQTFNLFGIGAAEWQGWSVVDGNFWVGADTQGREEFVGPFEPNRGALPPLGQGAIAVADPDEWDDFDPSGISPEDFVDPITGDSFYETELFSPTIVIPMGATANTARLICSSSWQEEFAQRARLAVSYNGGPFTTIFNWTYVGDPEAMGTFDPNSLQGETLVVRPTALNEELNVALGNPEGASTMQLRFDLYNADNDWWWAIDNVIVAVEGIEAVLPPTPFNLIVESFQTDGSAELNWTQATNTDAYDVLVARNPNFTDIAFQATTNDLSAVASLRSGVYYARVTARNGIGSVTREAAFAVDTGCDADRDGDGNANINDVLIFARGFSGGCDGSLNN